MNNEFAKAISTCAIWLGISCALTFGVFKITANGDLAVLLIFFVLPCAMISGAVVATQAVWKSEPQVSNRVASAASAGLKTGAPPVIR
jgi:hypothetical protein